MNLARSNSGTPMVGDAGRRDRGDSGDWHRVSSSSDSEFRLLGGENWLEASGGEDEEGKRRGRQAERDAASGSAGEYV